MKIEQEMDSFWYNNCRMTKAELEELIQEVFLKMSRHLMDFKGRSLVQRDT
jgi:DNA-directed RNA polymerase specialized sigma24 family protein